MNKELKPIRIIISSLLLMITCSSNASVIFNQVINNSSVTFTVKNSNLTIPAYGFVDLHTDPWNLDQATVTLLPDNDPELEISLKNNDAGLSLLHPAMSGCNVVRTRIVTLPDGQQMVQNRQSEHIVCRNGENILEINPEVVRHIPSWQRYDFNAIPADSVSRAKRYNTSITKAPASICYSTLTDLFVPGFTKKGTLCESTYPSNTFQPPNTTQQEYVIYLPHGYFDETDRRYPVLFYLHGIPGTPQGDSKVLSIVLDLAIAANLATPMIVVFPNGNTTVETFMGVPVEDLPPLYKQIFSANGQLPNYWANSPALGNMEDDIVFTLYDYVDANFRTKKGRQFHGMNGFSGGGGSHQVVLPHTDRFGAVSSDSGFGVNWPQEMLIYPTIDEIAGGLAYSAGFTYTHLETLYVNAPMQVTNPLATYLGNIYNQALAFSPDPMAPYGAAFPTDANGNLVSSVVAAWATHSATIRAQLYQTAIKKNNLQILFSAGGYDFFYYLELINPDREILYDVLTLGASYYNGTSHSYSTVLNGLNINHDFVSYVGNHNQYSAIQSLSSIMFHSAVFLSKNPERAKIMGKGDIILRDGASLNIFDTAVLGIESDVQYTSTTSLQLTLENSSKVLIGNMKNTGGALQIGNPIDPLVFEASQALRDQTISCSIVINGPDASFNINRGAIFGMGVGIQGHIGANQNEAVVRSLENVEHIGLLVQEGIFNNNQILPGTDPDASLLIVGPAQRYAFSCKPIQTRVRGGGNLALIDDAINLQTTFPSAFVNATRISTDPSNTVTYIEGNFAGPVIQGIRDKELTSQIDTVLVGFVNQLVSLDGAAVQGLNLPFPAAFTIFPAQAHKNTLNVNVMSSQPMLFDENKPVIPFYGTQDELFNFLKVDNYDAQDKKRAPLSDNGGIPAALVYIDFSTTLTVLEEIIRVPQQDFPLDLARSSFADLTGISPNTVTINNGLPRAAVGILLNRTTPRQLAALFDLEDADEFDESQGTN